MGGGEGALSARPYLDISSQKVPLPSPALRGSVFDLYRNCELPGVQAASLVGFDPSPGCNHATGVFGYDFFFLIFRDILADRPDVLEPPFTGHGYPLARTLGAHRNFGGAICLRRISELIAA